MLRSLLWACLLLVPLACRPAEPPSLVDLVAVPEGRFQQGSPESEAGRRDREGPQREVVVPAFALGQHEVTIDQFRAFVEATGYVTDAERNAPFGERPAMGCFSHRTPGVTSPGWVEGRSWRDPGFPQADDHPVVCVTRSDATAFIAWLNTQSEQPYRLPSESEFEYAYRAGTQTPRPWSADTVPCTVLNHGDAHLLDAVPDWPSATSACDDGFAFTAPVGHYGANAWGLSDLAGNVSEFVSDCWHDSYADAPTDGRAWLPPGSEDCARPVLRGGDFVSRPEQLRAAARTWIPDGFRTYHVGFRVAQDR